MNQDKTIPPGDTAGLKRRWLFRGSAVRTTMIYALLGAIWILISDAAVLMMTEDPAAIERLQNFKGILYVTVTTLLVYVLARGTAASAREEALNSKLKETRHYLDSVLTHLGDSILMVDSDHRAIVQCNATVTDMFGYAPEELMHNSTEMLHLDKERFDRFFDIGEPMLKQHGVFRTQYPMRHKDGHTLQTEITVLTLEKTDGWKAGVISIIRDISEAIQTRNLLEESERKHRLLAENTLDVIWATDLEGIITYVNPAVETLTGRTQKDSVGTHIREFSTSKSLQQFEEMVQREIGKGPGKSDVVIQTEILHADGTVIPVETHGKILFDALGRPTGVQAVNRDIRERVAMEAQLRQAQKMESIGTLASGIAHEVNNPIMIISGFAQMIGHREGSDDKTRELAEKIDGETHRIQKIVDNLLSFSRLDNRESAATFNIRSAFDDALGLVHASLRHDNILVKVRTLNAEIPKVHGHPYQLQQVFLNLLTNARDALNRKFPDTDTEKRILVTPSVLQEGNTDWARLTIEDRGCGLSSEEEKRMFDPFFTTKSKGKGTGLGLWISYGIVKEHHGRLSVETREGDFTRFHVDLPADGKAESDST